MARSHIGVAVEPSAHIDEEQHRGRTAVALASGEIVAADAVLWTTGVRVSPIAAAAGLEVDDRGRIITDGSLRSVSHRNVYAVCRATSRGRQLWHQIR